MCPFASDSESNADDPRRQDLRASTLQQRRDLPPPKPPRTRSRPQSRAGSTPAPSRNPSIDMPARRGLRGGAGKSSSADEGGNAATDGEGLRGRGLAVEPRSVPLASTRSTVRSVPGDRMEKEKRKATIGHDPASSSAAAAAAEGEKESTLDYTTVLLYTCAALAVLVVAMLVYHMMRTTPAPNSTAETVGGSAERPDTKSDIMGGKKNVKGESEQQGGSSTTDPGTSRTTCDASKTMSFSEMDRDHDAWVERTVTLHRN